MRAQFRVSPCELGWAAGCCLEVGAKAVGAGPRHISCPRPNVTHAEVGRRLGAWPDSALGLGGVVHLPGSALPVRSWEKLAAGKHPSPGSPKLPSG